MKHPEILLIPVFALADYYLTLIGATLREKNYGNHYKKEHYELNPVWQNAITEKKWINPKQLLLTIIEIALVFIVVEIGDMPETLYQVLLGFLFTGYGILIGNHVGNIFTFWHVTRKPEEITGQVFETHGFSLSKSAYQLITVLLPLVMILIFAPSPFVMGAALNCVLMIATHMIWIGINRKRTREMLKSDYKP